MNLVGLLPLIRRTARFRELAAALRGGGRHRLALHDAAKTYLLAALADELEVPLLVVAASAARSRQIAEALRGWLGEARPVELFAERDALPYERLSTDPLTAQARLRALAALAEQRAPIVVATGRGLMDRIAAPDEFASRFVELRPGALSDPAVLAEQLVGAGFRPTPLVEEPGAFSRRGGIVDVFPPTAAAPVRIEFFGDEIDTLRRFDPATQRSTGPIDELRIVPAVELFTPALPSVVARLGELADDGLSEEGLASWRRDVDRLATGEEFEGAELYAGHLAATGLLAHFPADGLVVLDEPEALQVEVEQIEGQADELFQELLGKNMLPRGLARPYVGWSEIAPELARRDGLDLAWRPAADPEQAGAEGAVDFGGALAVATPYGGRLKVVIDDVQAALAAGQRVVVVTQQDARLAELFRERDVAVGQTADLDEAPPGGTLTLVHGGASEGFRLVGLSDGDLLLLTDREVFGWTKPRRAVRSRATARDTFLSDLSVGDFVVHVEHGVGRFTGLTHMDGDASDREYLGIEYAAGDRLFVPVDQADRVSRYIGTSEGEPTLHRLGGTEWARAKSRVKAAVREMARELLELYAAREVAPGHAFPPDTTWQRELEDAFPYVETPDQLAAITEVKADMESPRPMDRLLCGDVGYGKTEVALRAAFKAVMDGRQVAVLVPTTVLAQQHFNTFRERMQAFPVRVEMLSRFRSDKEQRRVIEGLKSGAVDVCIGTHRLVQKDVEFKELGLVIIDEEQRFGVAHKERLKQLRKQVDVLTLTATPIPRTLHMSLAGVRDMSTMETAPEDRLPIRTYVQGWDDGLVREVILREIDRGGQVYFVHNRVQTIYQLAQQLKKLVPSANFLIGHGQLPEEQLERVMLQFAEGKADVLLCTTIIESGLDIPNVNTIVVNNADQFGLSQLYQLRGRVGRGANRAYAYFLYRKGAQLTEVAEKRLRTIFEANELGSGFRIAMRDLEIRGAGNLLGAEQSGHVASVGFQLYTQLLAEAVDELRGRPVETAPEVTIDLPLDAHLPKEYVQDEATRLSLYRRLASVRSLDEVGAILGEMGDRFGTPPEPALNLIWLLQLKHIAAAAGAMAVSATENELLVRFAQDQPARLKALEPRFAPYLRAGRSVAFLDRVGLGRRWQETLVEFLEALAPTAAPQPVPAR